MTLLFSLLLSFTLHSADNPVPPEVEAAFAHYYADVPNAAVVWGVEEEDYVATFRDERDRLTKAFFSSDGLWEETHTRLYPSQMPRPVRLYYEAHHEEKDVSFMGQVQYPNGKEAYRIEWETYEAVHIEKVSPAGELLETQVLSFTEGLDVW